MATGSKRLNAPTYGFSETRRERAQERANESAERKRAESERREALNDPRLELQRNTRQAANDYRAALRTSGVTKAPQRESAFDQMSLIHQAYASNMVLGLVGPLARGASGPAIMNTIGMGTALLIMSPQFRKTLGNYAGKLGDSIAQRAEARKDARINTTKEKAGQIEAVFDGTDTSFKARMKRILTPNTRQDRVMNQWAARVESYENERRGRVPFTIESAALTHVGLAESAYFEMRQPGANVPEIQANYDFMIGDLYNSVVNENTASDSTPEQAKAQGDWVRQQTASQARTIIATRINNEAGFSHVFDELSHGAVDLEEPRVVRDPVTGVEMSIPHFKSVQGMTVTTGMFGVRPPMDWNDHQTRFTNILVRDMVDEDGPEALDQTFRAYAWGVDFQDMDQVFPEQADSFQDKQRVRRIKSFFNAMEADGFSKEDQRQIYLGSVATASAVLGDSNPVLSAEWAAKYGENWREEWRDKDSGFGAGFDARRAQEAAERQAQRDAAYEAGTRNFQEHTGVDEDGKPTTWFENTKGDRVSFDERTMQWGYEDIVNTERMFRMDENIHYEDVSSPKRDVYEGYGRKDEDIVDAEIVEDDDIPEPPKPQADVDADDMTVTPEEFAAYFGSAEDEDDFDEGFAQDDAETEWVEWDENDPFSGLDEDIITVPPIGPARSTFDSSKIDLVSASVEARRVLMVNSMSDFMARDMAHPEVIGGEGLAGSQSAVGVYANSLRALSSDEPYGSDAASNQRAQAMREMRDMLDQANLSQGDADKLYATAYVQALEDASLRDPSLEGWLESRKEDFGHEDWRESEYERVSRQTVTDFPSRNYEKQLEQLSQDCEDIDVDYGENTWRKNPEVVHRAVDSRRRLMARATYRRVALNRTIENQGKGIVSHDQTLLDRFRDGNISDGRERDINDPGQAFV